MGGENGWKLGDKWVERMGGNWKSRCVTEIMYTQ